MLTDDPELVIRDAALAPIAWNVAPIEFSCRVEWLDLSGWTATLPTYVVDESGDKIVSPDVIALRQPGSGVVVRDGSSGGLMFSGMPFLTGDGLRTATKRIVNQDSNGIATDTFEVSGVADFGLLDERAVDVYFTDDQVRIGTASTVVHELIKQNLGVDAGLNRVDPLVNLLPDPVVGPNINVAYKPGESLLEVIRKACALGGITVDVFQDARKIKIQIREPNDLSDFIVLSPDLGTLPDWTLNEEPTEATAVYAVRPGEFAREVAVVRTGSPIREIERTVPISVPWANGSLGYFADFEWEARRGATTLKADAGLTDLRLGVDFKIGDFIGVEVPDLETGAPIRKTERITAAEIKWNADGVETSIEIGGPEPYGTDAMLRALRDQAREIQALRLQAATPQP